MPSPSPIRQQSSKPPLDKIDTIRNLAFGRDFSCEVCDFSGDMVDSEGTFSMSIEFSSNPSFPNSEKNNSRFPYHGSFSDPNIRVPGFREE